MIKRRLHKKLIEGASQFPVVTLTGPRQSGKTTLCRMAFPDKAYVSLEAPDNREYAQSDPRGFLDQYSSGVVIDEVQRAPDILSYIQEEVDERRSPGLFILTGSANLSLLESVSQSLAGRTALVNLLPLSLDEVRLFPSSPEDLFSTLLYGGYPAIFDQGIPHYEWLSSYVGTYVERDVRQVLNVTNLSAFQTFLRLCAGRAGHLLNLSGLGADCGVTHNTAKSWLSVLEAGYIVFRLPPFHSSLAKRLVKAPKLHFYDSGLLCFLLGIQNQEQLQQHPLRGAIFESWVISEIIKACVHQGMPEDFYFYRDRKGAEVDLLYHRGNTITAVEIKSGLTVSSDFFTAFERLERSLFPEAKLHEIVKILIYGGKAAQKRSNVSVFPWSDITAYNWTA